MFKYQDLWASGFTFTKYAETQTVGEILWQSRGIDLIGQIIVLFVGVYGVAILFGRGKPNA